MSNTTCSIRQHTDTGLLYTLCGHEALIVGCTVPDAVHVVIPPVISEGTAKYRVTGIGEAAFSYMSELKTISLPESLTRIGHGAFEGSGLTEITLHSGVDALAPYAFFNCVHLSHVKLPANDGIRLPEQVFGGCTSLQRCGVENLHYVADEDILHSGLPSPTDAAIRYTGTEDGSTDVSPAGLLQQGLQLEKENRCAEAAVCYNRAHRLRTAASKNPRLDAQLADLSAVTEAEYRLGVLLKLGLAPEKNPDGTIRPTAAELLHTAADTGSIADAAYHLGDLYAGGYGVPLDSSKALKYLKKAAALGHERACMDLGYIYLDGTLAAASLPAALLYFNKCAALNGPYAALADIHAAKVAQHLSRKT